jgi:hypothetical protein
MFPGRQRIAEAAMMDHSENDRSKLRKIRQVAGRAGAKARWEHMAAWHRDLEQLRGGFKNDGWRLCCQHLLLRYIFLWRGGGKALSPDAEDELAALAGLLRPRTGHWTIDRIAGMVRMDNSDWHLPMLNIRWSWQGLRWLLNVTNAESERLESVKESRQPKPEPSPSAVKRGERRMQLLALSLLRKRGDARPSLRTIQAELLQRTGRTVSLRTIAQDLGQRR